MSDLTGKVALINGVGQNIGLATARRMAQGGARLAVSDIDEQAVQGAAKELGATPLIGDVRRSADVERLIASTVEQLGQLDVLVNTAGKSSFGPVVELAESAWDLEIETNLKGSFLIGQAAAREMIRRGAGGRIIFFGSTAAESARVGAASHCASKAGVLMLAKVMALELGRYGITVNAVSPGLVPRPQQGSSQEYQDSFRSMVPMGRLGQPEDLAGAVAFLASDEASWITGEVLHVDGGFLAGRALPSGRQR